MFPDGTGVPMRQSIAKGRVFVVELLLHRPVTSLRAAVTTLRGGEIRPVEQIGVGVVRHRGELLGRRPAPPRERMWHHKNTAFTLLMREKPRWFPSMSRGQALRLSAALMVLGKPRVQVGEEHPLRDLPRRRGSHAAESLVRGH